MKKKFLCILLSTTLLLTGCGSATPKDTSSDTSSLDLTETTDPYGQTVYNSGTSSEWTWAEKVPTYVKYGKKYINFKSIEGYYNYNDSNDTYGAYILLTIDRKNLSKKDINYLTDLTKGNLTSLIYVSEKHTDNMDDKFNAKYIGSRYDKKKWTMYYYITEPFENKPETLFTSISFHLTEPNSDNNYSCSVNEFELKNSDFEQLDSKRGTELNECMYNSLDDLSDSYNDNDETVPYTINNSFDYVRNDETCQQYNVITDGELTDEDLQTIYQDIKDTDSNYLYYTIHFYSDKSDVKTANSYATIDDEVSTKVVHE